jgi:hypothetical protein
MKTIDEATMQALKAAQVEFLKAQKDYSASSPRTKADRIVAYDRYIAAECKAETAAAALTKFY